MVKPWTVGLSLTGVRGSEQRDNLPNILAGAWWEVNRLLKTRILVCLPDCSIHGFDPCMLSLLVCLQTSPRNIPLSKVRPDFCQMSPDGFFHASAQCLMTSDTEGLLHFLSWSLMILLLYPFQSPWEPGKRPSWTALSHVQSMSRMYPKWLFRMPPLFLHAPVTLHLPGLLPQPLDSCSCFYLAFQ